MMKNIWHKVNSILHLLNGKYARNFYNSYHKKRNLRRSEILYSKLLATKSAAEQTNMASAFSHTNTYTYTHVGSSGGRLIQKQ